MYQFSAYTFLFAKMQVIRWLSTKKCKISPVEKDTEGVSSLLFAKEKYRTAIDWLFSQYGKKNYFTGMK